MDVVRVTAGQLERVASGTVRVVEHAAVFEIDGPQAVDCVQGILTNDVAAPGAGALLYAAMLTPKGMIAVDYLVFRLGEGFVLVADAGGRERSTERFGRLLPPRLARVTDRSESASTLWLLGPRTAADPVLAAALAHSGWPGFAALEPGRATRLERGDDSLAVGAAPPGHEFAWVLVGAGPVVAQLAEALDAGGAAAGDRSDLRAARVASGVPTSGAEIGERTLPQEVRFDELGGVSYTKGCYVGQETVARVHFRGHPNWRLQGVCWDAPAPAPAGTPTAVELSREGRPVGGVTTLVLVDGDVRHGLASVRREVEPGDRVDSDLGPARVVTPGPGWTRPKRRGPGG